MTDIIPTEHALTLEEHAKLTACEQTIEAGLRNFMEVGAALLEIQAGRLYRMTHRSFEAYLAERWNLKRTRAYELIEAATIVGGVSEISDTVPARESHAAALAPLPTPEAQAEAWQEATETAPEGKVTAKHVAGVVRRRRRESPDPDPNPDPDDAVGAMLARTPPTPEMIRLRASMAFSRRWGAVTTFLAQVDPVEVAGILDDSDYRALLTARMLLDRWFRELEGARRRPLHVIGGREA